VVQLAEGLFARRSVALTGSAVMGALAALSTVILPAQIQPAFLVLPFLRFDPAELFSVLAFLIFGPIAAIVTATVHWLFLTVTGTGEPLGPAAKFAAVLSTLFGLWLGSLACQRLMHNRMSFALGLMLAFATLTRVLILLVVNFFIFTYIGPVIFGINYLGFSQTVLQDTLHMQFAGPSQVLLAILLFTSVFNALHAVFSVALPYLVVTPLSSMVPQLASEHPWISRLSKP
jgi:riboflavin transporter FmnP